MYSKNQKSHLMDPAYLSHFPLIEIKKSKYANITCNTPIFWLEQNQYDSLGPAMIPIASYRYLLNHAGLDINLDDTMAFDKYINKINNGKEAIFFSRFLIYLGFHNRAKDLVISCKEIKESSKEIKSWCDLILTQIKRATDVYNWDINLLSEIKNIELKKLSPQLQFLISLWKTIYWTTIGFDKSLSTKYIDNCYSILNTFEYFTSNIYNRVLALSRLARYQSVHLLNLKKKEEYNKLIYKTLHYLDDLENCKKVLLNKSNEFFITEHKRRLLEFHSINLFETNEYKQAIPYIMKAVELDPNCPKALMLAGFAQYKSGFYNNSYKLLNQAIFKGVLERSYCKRLIEKISYLNRNNTFIINRKDEINITESIQTTSEFESIMQSPAMIKNYENISKKFKIESNDIIEYLKTKNIYSRYLPFWELRPAQIENSPILTAAPLVAMDAWHSKKNPFFSSLYIQRIMMPLFRSELWYGSISNSKLAKNTIEIGNSLDFIKNLSLESSLLLSNISNITNLSVLNRNLIARIVGNLGYIKDAIKLSELCPSNNVWTVEETYLVCTNLFYRFIQHEIEVEKFCKELEIALLRIPKVEETLRARFSLSIIGCICCGQSKNILLLVNWVTICKKLVDSIILSPSFSDFEKGLLYSRYFRAVCYFPFLNDDKTELLYEAEMCEKYARNLIPGDEHEEILMRDNIYSMLDTLQRVYVKLGDFNKAESMLLEIHKKIDPYDSKSLNQLGDFYEKQGKIDKAIHFFCKGVEYGIPQGRVSAFRAGYLLESTGEYDQAIEYYFKSLDFWPDGLSPVQGILRIAKKTKDKYLENWSKNKLKKI